MKTRRTAAVAVAAATLSAVCAAAAGAAAAGAAPSAQNTYQQTYPVVSRLCTEVARGEGPARLQPYAAQALADCATLETAFDAANGAELAAEAPVIAALATERHAARTACARPRLQAVACALGRQAKRANVESLEGERRSVHVTYHQSLEASRQAFWGAIHALPHCAGVY
jgi:hypothetical protein